jgi:hypothetical protein
MKLVAGNWLSSLGCVPQLDIAIIIKNGKDHLSQEEIEHMVAEAERFAVAKDNSGRSPAETHRSILTSTCNWVIIDVMFVCIHIQFANALQRRGHKYY